MNNHNKFICLCKKNHKKDYFSVEILLKSKSSPPWGIYLDALMTFYDDLI